MSRGWGAQGGSSVCAVGGGFALLAPAEPAGVGAGGAGVSGASPAGAVFASASSPRAVPCPGVQQALPSWLCPPWIRAGATPALTQLSHGLWIFSQGVSSHNWLPTYLWHGRLQQGILLLEEMIFLQDFREN